MTKRQPTMAGVYPVGGPISTLGALAETMEGTRQEIKSHCIQALSDIGASEEYCEFFGDVLQTEHDMNTAVYKLQISLTQDEDGPINPARLFLGLQELTRNYNQWKSTIDALTHRGTSIPALDVDKDVLNNNTALKLLCSLDTKDVHLEEGEQITITDAKSNKLKVLTKGGSEGYVPALCCVLPTPDRTAITATERLKIQLLCSWTECVRKTKRLLSDSLLTNCKRLAREWKPPQAQGVALAKDRVTRRVRRILDCATRAPHCDYNKLHSCLYSLEKELNSHSIHNPEVGLVVDKVANLDKSVLCFYNFYKQWHTYRRVLEVSSIRPIKVVENLLELRRSVPHNRNYKYLEYKMTVENVETVEEILYVNDVAYAEGSTSSGFGSRTETVKADQITSSEQEERKRFIIKGVVDPRDKSRVISIRDAIEEGIVNQETGMYVNLLTGESCPIPQAMNEQLILVDFQTSTKSVEKTRAIGLITVKSPVDDQSFKMTGAVDPFTGERVDMVEAKRRGLVDAAESCYNLVSTCETFPIHDAVMTGWVIADFDGGEQKHVIKTYAVHSVVDQRLKKKVPFQEAVNRGLIDKRTGTYVNNATSERIYVVEAIRRGFLKAKVIENDNGLDIDAENKMVVERVDRIRKSVLKSVGVIHAFKQAAKHKEAN